MHPSISLGPLALSTWRVVVLSGVALCWLLLVPRAKKLGWAAGPVLAFLVMELAVGTIGGHVLNVLIPLVFGTPGSSATGLTVIGTTVGTLSFGAWYLPRVLKINPFEFMDAAAFTYGLALAVGRLGCLLNGCCFGMFAPDHPHFLAKFFTIPVEAFSPLSQAGAALAGAPAGARLWNLQLLLSLNGVLSICVAELLFRNRKKWRLLPGTVVAAALGQETLGRFLMEFLRRDELVGASRYNPWQLSLLGLLAVFTGGFVWLMSRRRAPDVA